MIALILASYLVTEINADGHGKFSNCSNAYISIMDLVMIAPMKLSVIKYITHFLFLIPYSCASLFF